MNTDILKIIDEIRCGKLRDTCAVFSDPRFTEAPASLSFHHAYEGGLLAHTLEVVRYAKAQAFMMSQVDMDVLLTAALWHDFAKVSEYEEVAYDENRPGRSLIRIHLYGQPPSMWVKRTSLLGDHSHIMEGMVWFTEAANRNQVSDNIVRKIQHCILSHHGREEWGSPVEPKTLEALILHQADMLSAHHGAAKYLP